MQGKSKKMMIVPLSAFKKLQEKGKDKNATISDLEHKLLLL